MRELRAVLLASASPRRRELLASVGLRVLVMPSEVDEVDPPDVAPRAIAEHYAKAKADAVLARIGKNVMIAADTVVDLDGQPFGKPADPAHARAMLRALSGREHLVHTAFEVVDGTTGDRLARCSTTRVRFAPLGSDEIDAYVATGEPLDKAGAYGVQGRGAALVDSIDGDYHTVMGFPLGLFVRSLSRLGLRLHHDAEAVAAQRGAALP
jgi:nucleoside triphosphate pyrophosphatase